MTLSTLIFKDQYYGDGATADFDVTFQFQNASELQVVILDTDGVTEISRTLASHYNVSGGNGSTGVVTFTAGNIPTGDGNPGSQVVTIVRNMLPTQSADLTENDPFPADTVEVAIADRLMMIVQQQQEQINRGVKLKVSSNHDPITIVEDPVAGKMPIYDDDGNIVNGPTLSDVAVVAAISSEVQALAAIVDDISTAAGDSADIQALADITSQIQAVAAIVAQVTTVASDSAAIQALAAITTEIQALAAIVSSIVTAAGIDTEIAAVAAIVADVQAVAANIADIQNAEENADLAEAARDAAAISAAAAVAAQLAADIDITEKISAPPSVDLIAVPEAAPDPYVTFTRATTATRVTRTGILEVVAANVLRHEYDPATGDYKGWLFEESSTNLILQSDDLTTTWSTGASYSVTANQGVGPFGTASLDKIIPANTISSFNSDEPEQTITKAASALTYTASFYAREDEVNSVRIVVAGASAGNNATAVFNLATQGFGTVAVNGTFTNVSAQIEEYRDGLYRCSMTFTSDTSTSLVVKMYAYDNALAFTGDGASGVLVGGFQVEQKGSPTSYIPTTTVAVARNDDLFQLNSSAYDWLNGDEGTIYVEMEKPATVPNTTSMIGVQVSDGSNSDYASIQIYTDTLVRALSAGSSVAIGTTNTPLSGAIMRGAFAYKSGETPADNTAVNGTASTSGNTAVTYAGLDRMYVGVNNTSGTTINERSFIRRAAYWPIRLTGAQLEAITG